MSMKEQTRTSDPASRRLRTFVYLVLGSVALPSLLLSGFGLVAIDNERGATEDRVRSLYAPVARQLAQELSEDLAVGLDESRQALADLSHWAMRDKASPGARFFSFAQAHPELAGWFAFDQGRVVLPRAQPELDTRARFLSSDKGARPAEFAGDAAQAAQGYRNTPGHDGDCELVNALARAERRSGAKDAAVANYARAFALCEGVVDRRGYDKGLGAGLAVLDLIAASELPARISLFQALASRMDSVRSPAASEQRAFVALRALERTMFWPMADRGPEFTEARARLIAVAAACSFQRKGLASFGKENGSRLHWSSGPGGSELHLIWSQAGVGAGAMVLPEILEAKATAALSRLEIGHQVKARILRGDDGAGEEKGYAAGAAWLGEGPLAWKLELRLMGDSALDDLARSRTTLYLWLLVALVMALLAGIAGTLYVMARETRLSRLKTDFVSSVSHELRTPLTSIRLYVDTLLMDRVDGEKDRRQCLQVISAESERLSRLVERILDFSRMEAGRKAYRMQAARVVDLMDAAVEACRPLLDEQDFELEMDLGADLPALWADPQAVEEVLINLLSNAIKYSGPSRWIALRAAVDEEFIRLEVEDRGVGIARSEQGRVFEKFYRVETALSSEVSGSGLGLSLVRYIVDAHGGRVSLRSEPGHGSTFSVWLPVVRQEEARS